VPPRRDTLSVLSWVSSVNLNLIPVLFWLVLVIKRCYIDIMAVCSYCNNEYPGGGKMFSHQWRDHRDEKIASIRKANVGRASIAKEVKIKHKSSPQDGSGAESKTLSKTANLDNAVAVAIAPRRFEMDSALLWQARAAAIKEWDWPNDIEPGDFLDTFLFEAFKQRGIILGAYQVIDHNKGGGNGS